MVILAEDEGRVVLLKVFSTHGAGELFWGSLQRKRVLLGILVEQESCSEDLHEVGEFFW